MRAKALIIGFFFLTSVGLASSAHAFDPDEQVHGSDVILTGRVVSVQPQMDKTRGESWTDAEVEIGQIWKGSPAGTRVIVRTPGGTLDNPGLSLEGSARFTPGEDVLLFLTEAGHVYRPWRTVFGKYAIRGQGMDAQLVGELPPMVADTEDLYTPAIALEELREEVQLIVAGRHDPERLDVALGDFSETLR